MDGIGLKQLAESIRAEGVLQPLFVRKIGLGRYEIVAGERRWQAAKIAGLDRVPVLIRDVSDRAALAIALVENLRREDLNPIDQAMAIRRLIEEFSMTHQEVAGTIGCSRATVSNMLRLLLLPTGVKAMVAAGEIDMGHARALLSLPLDQQLPAAEYVVAEKISVRSVERMAQRSEPDPPVELRQQDPDASPKNPQPRRSSLAPRLGENIELTCDDSGRWQLNMTFGDLQELHGAVTLIDDFIERLEQPPEQQLGLELHSA
jgi:ParB family chromosome partitioning protein